MEMCRHCATDLRNLQTLYAFDGYLFCCRGCALSYLIDTQNHISKQISERTRLASKLLDAYGEEIPNNIV